MNFTAPSQVLSMSYVANFKFLIDSLCAFAIKEV